MRRLSILLLATAAVTAQVPSATITGTISDPQGLPLFKANITVKSLDTPVQMSRDSAGDGTFRLAGLPPGNYSLKVTREGFSPYEVLHVKLEVRQAMDLSIRLKIGGVLEIVRVSEPATPIEAAAEPMGFNVDGKQIELLPLVQRDIAGLAVLGPGVIPRHLGGFTNDLVSAVEPVRGNVAENPPINGMRATMNTYLLDGVLNTDSNVRVVVVNPPVEAIQEFRLQGSASGPDFGYSGGGVLNVVTRSGTGRLHGGLFDYLRNEALDARNYFDAGLGPKPAFRQNQFGGQLGGKIPHTARLFFFAAYEGLQLNQGQSQAGSVPTKALRSGDFTGTADIGDPLTGLPFPNNQIPAARIDPIARAIVDQYEPQPNQPGSSQNFLSATPVLRGNDNVNGRVDWNTAARGNFFARYSIGDERADQSNGQLLEPTIVRLRAQQAAIGHTYAGSGNWVNEFRAGFNRLRILDLSVNAYTNDAIGRLGINGIDRDPVNFGLPTFVLASNLLITSDDNTLPLTQASQTFQALDHWSVRRGRHTAQLGGEIRHFGMAYQQRMNSRGTFGFGGGYSGDPFGDFLLGLPANTQRTVGQPQSYLRQSGYAFYAQDEFRVTPALILTYGIRYDYNSPFKEKYNHMWNLDYSTLPRVPQLVQEGGSSSTMPTDLVAPQHADFAPRLGLAWRPLSGRNLIFRAAYGLYYNPEIARQSYDLVLNGVRTESDTAPPDMPILTLKNPFVSSRSTGFPTYFGIDPHEKMPYAQQWNAAWQYGTRGFLFELGYLGAKGTHLGRFRKFNTPQHVETGENLGPRAGDIQSLRTFPALGPFIQRQNIANSIYHALQLRAERRWARGFAMQASFTWSKSLDDADSVIQGLFDSVGAQDERNLRLERGPSFNNVPRRFTVNFSYDLPFGHKHWLTSGWTISGTGLLQDGTPENAFYFFQDPANSDTFNRPNIVPGQSIALPADQRNPMHWFNTAAFSDPAPLTFGNAGRNLLPTPANKVFNFSVNRRFTLGEGRSLSLRTDFFNAFNHPDFGIPLPNKDFGPFFGQVFAVGDPRQIQMSLKFAF